MEGKKHAFPSPRQANCAGLKKQFYADYLRSLVDYDYADELTEEERIWLAAFTEEYYRGWRLKRETQLHSLDDIRAAAARAKLVREHEDPLAFDARRGPSIEDMIARTTGKYNDGEGAASQDGAVQARLLAGSQLLDEHELRDGRNHVEDDLIDQIDRKRALARRRS